MAKCISAEKARAGLRHALVCLNVTERTKGKIVRSKTLAIVDWPQVARTCILRAFDLQISCRLSLVLRLFCFASLCVYAFTEAAALRPTVLRSSICMRPDSHSCFFLFFLFLEMSPFLSIFVPLLCYVCIENTSHVSPTAWCLNFNLITTGWIFDISLYDQSINQSIDQRARISKQGAGVRLYFTKTWTRLLLYSRFIFQCKHLAPAASRPGWTQIVEVRRR